VGLIVALLGDIWHLRCHTARLQLVAQYQREASLKDAELRSLVGDS
jgi:hypothetical protein